MPQIRGDIMDCFHSIDKEIEEVINSGKYPIAGLNLLNHLETIEIFDTTKDHIEYTMELYKNYLTNIQKIPENYKIKFLETLKAAEIMDNQKLEAENSFLISLYMTVMGTNSIDEMIKLNNEKITSKKIIEIQSLLLQGTTSNKKEITGYRKNNRSYVGTIKNGIRNIQYFPINYTEIEEAVNKFIIYYNKATTKEEDIFIKPFIIHGIMSALQLFEDGNTRLSRLFQHIKLWEMTNEKLKCNLPLPAIYISRSYYPYRTEYREKIKNIVVNDNIDSWNDWFNFNLNRLEDQLFYIDTNLEEFQKIIK